MKSSIRISVIIFTLFILNISFYSQEQASVITRELQMSITPGDALKMLKEGNERFLSGSMTKRDLMEQVKASANGQYPHSVVLSCIDARVAPELVFDQGIGDIFDARVAGNFVNEDILGSLEFACKITGAKLILVMGHTNCGAIKGAIDDAQLGNLTQMLDKIKPSVEKTNYSGEKTSKNYTYVDLVSKENVMLAIENIKLKSPVLKEMIDRGKLGLQAVCMTCIPAG